jgi:hypothetical protein
LEDIMPRKTVAEIKQEEAKRIADLMLNQWLKEYHDDPWSFPTAAQRSWVEGYAQYVAEKILEVW